MHFAVVGEGEFRNNLEFEILARALSSRVRLIGEVDSEVIPDFLRCGDIFVSPSLCEGFGLAGVEAMFEGLPVIAADTPPLPEIIADGGILLPMDESSWIDAIRCLLVDYQQRQKLAQLAKARAAKFSLKEMADNFESLS